MFVVFRSLIACCAVFIFAACPAVAGSLITGIDLSELTSALRQQFSISESTHGVVILSVEAKSVFAEKNFHSGQLIIAVGATTTTTPNDVASAIAEQRKQGKLESFSIWSNPQARSDTSRFPQIASRSPRSVLIWDRH